MMPKFQGTDITKEDQRRLGSKAQKLVDMMLGAASPMTPDEVVAAMKRRFPGERWRDESCMRLLRYQRKNGYQLLKRSRPSAASGTFEYQLVKVDEKVRQLTLF